MQSFPLNTCHTEILFSEQDCVVSFDQMIRLSYEVHPANVYLESRPQRLEMDQIVASASQPKGLGDKFNDHDSSSLVIPSLTTSIKSGNCNEHSLLTSSAYEQANEREKEKSEILNLRMMAQNNIAIDFQQLSKSKTIKNNSDETLTRRTNLENKIRVPSINSNSQSNQSNQRKSRFRRWGRKQDIETFKLLRSELRLRGMKEVEFFGYEIDEILDHFTQTIKSSAHKNLIDQICRDLNWMRTPYHLLLRIMKFAKNQKFSFREKALLKKLINMKIYEGKINFDEISNYFSGKFKCTIINEVKTMLHLAK